MEPAMLNDIIRFSLRHPLLLIALSLVALGHGGYELYHLPIDVFPDLNRPRVTVITEAPAWRRRKSRRSSHFR
jgi:HME family heavy-metal exporter